MLNITWSCRVRFSHRAFGRTDARLGIARACVIRHATSYPDRVIANGVFTAMVCDRLWGFTTDGAGLKNTHRDSLPGLQNMFLAAGSCD